MGCPLTTHGETALQGSKTRPSTWFVFVQAGTRCVLLTPSVILAGKNTGCSSHVSLSCSVRVDLFASIFLFPSVISRAKSVYSVVASARHSHACTTRSPCRAEHAASRGGRAGGALVQPILCLAPSRPQCRPRSRDDENRGLCPECVFARTVLFSLARVFPQAPFSCARPSSWEVGAGQGAFSLFPYVRAAPLVRAKVKITKTPYVAPEDSHIRCF